MSSVHPTDSNTAAQFPGWEIERRSDGLLHAWLAGTDPPLVVSGKDAADLRNQIMSLAVRTHGSGRRRPPPRWAPRHWVLRSWRARITGSLAFARPSGTEPGAGQDQITTWPPERGAVVTEPVPTAGAIGSALPRGDRFQRLQALEDAIAWRRGRAGAPCGECAAASDGRCADHARDLDLIGEYQQAARRRGAGQVP